MKSAVNGFNFKLLPEMSECDFQIGQDKYCCEYANYYVWWSDKPGDYMMLCEKHMAEVYRRETGKAMPGYVDKDARIAALEAQLAERKQDAEVGRAIREYKNNCGYEMEIAISYYGDPDACTDSFSVHTTLDGVSDLTGGGDTLGAALVAAGLMEEE